MLPRSNQPVYPLHLPSRQEPGEHGYFHFPEVTFHGLTIREHFAAQFMAAMISNPVYDALEACIYSERAVMYADQLIAELAKPDIASTVVHADEDAGCEGNP